MSVSRAEDELPRDGAQGSVLPVLPDLFERIGDSLAERGRLGILSITVLERNVVDCTGGWHAYDRVVRTIARFLDRYRARRLRRDDRVFEPSLSGNAFVLVLGPPRAGRPVSAEDLAGVRERLRRGLRFHLGRSLPRDVLDRFSCYVGGALMTARDPPVPWSAHPAPTAAVRCAADRTRIAAAPSPARRASCHPARMPGR